MVSQPGQLGCCGIAKSVMFTAEELFEVGDCFLPENWSIASQVLADGPRQLRAAGTFSDDQLALDVEAALTGYLVGCSAPHSLEDVTVELVNVDGPVGVQVGVAGLKS